MTAYSALSPVTGLCCHRRPRDAKHHRRFSASLGAPGPRGLTVREASFVRTQQRMLRCLAATAPRLHVRDDRDTPLLTRRDARNDAADLPDTPSGIFLTRGLDGWNRVGSTSEISFCAQPILSSESGIGSMTSAACEAICPTGTVRHQLPTPPLRTSGQDSWNEAARVHHAG